MKTLLVVLYRSRSFFALFFSFCLPVISSISDTLPSIVIVMGAFSPFLGPVGREAQDLDLMARGEDGGERVDKYVSSSPVIVLELLCECALSSYLGGDLRELNMFRVFVENGNRLDWKDSLALSSFSLCLCVPASYCSLKCIGSVADRVS